LGRRLHWEAQRRGLGRAEWIFGAGGWAAWIWNVAADRWAEAEELLDFYHASEHLWELGRARLSRRPSPGVGSRAGYMNCATEKEEKFLAPSTD